VDELEALEATKAPARWRVLRGAVVLALSVLGTAAAFFVVGPVSAGSAGMLLLGSWTAGIFGFGDVTEGTGRLALTAKKIRELKRLPEARVLRLPP
jgi:hypothetical protein